ncbi:exodeoxyribonuclease I [Lysobacter pythonis]|uniref:Exodeoxyribonuclease I n=1 Tax=Solilutibacter pythonis TaxID=2483112 RepID=A0A3M2HYX5_9GAMM|nr:exodeoxyribonuclease I [Lysobacter pythonis]RMH94941.1 exodeoxyribonuclease I [Lysobacter pythonis]
MPASFLFYDLETFGSDPRRSRIAQFAAIRTDAELNETEAPISFFVQPALDLLPSPEATLVTRITPQRARHEGLPEAEAMARIFEAMARPETCTLGYNSLRFDDEFVRFGFWRNFFDAYEREWRGGNSRWDLLDVMRLAHALRPEGIEWRTREDGQGISFKLEHLAEDNGLREGMAHEALSDVRALIGLARQLKTAQPRLWDYALSLRDKRAAMRLLDTFAMRPLLHVSQRFPASRLCAAPVIPLTRHPRIDSRVIVFDLAQDIEPLLALSAEDIRDRLYVAQADLPKGEQRIALKEVHANRSPMLVEWAHLREADFDRLGLDPALVEARADKLRASGPKLAEKIRQVYAQPRDFTGHDVDGALYDGFIPDSDKRLMAQIRATPADKLAASGIAFRDPRLDELLLRYRARNWPDTLDFTEQARWYDYRRARMFEDDSLGGQTLAGYRAEIATLRARHAGDADTLALLDHLDAWGGEREAEIA